MNTSEDRLRQQQHPAGERDDPLPDDGTAGQRHHRLRLFAQHLERTRELERLELAASLQQDFQDLLARFNGALRALSGDRSLAENVREPLRQLTREAQQLQDHLREIVTDLAPPGIRELGFAGALRRLVDEQKARSGLQFALHVPEAAESAAKRVLAALYGVALEAIGNAVEHARARRIEVNVELRAGHLRLRVSDAGIGVSDHERHKPGRFGLFAAAERMAQVDGVLRVFGVPGSGTVVEASVTVDADGRPSHPAVRN